MTTLAYRNNWGYHLYTLKETEEVVANIKVVRIAGDLINVFRERKTECYTDNGFQGETTSYNYYAEAIMFGVVMCMWLNDLIRQGVEIELVEYTLED